MSAIVPAGVVTSKVIEDLEFGVLSDGSAYMTGRTLAKLCGIAPPTLTMRKSEWENSDRTSSFCQYLIKIGFASDRLATPIAMPGVGVASSAMAYREDAVMAVLGFYSFELPRRDAQLNLQRLAGVGVRAFVYGIVGYDPGNHVPPAWKEFHDRLASHEVQNGYFSVFREMAEMILISIQAGFRLDHRSVPDISVGQLWSKEWKNRNLAAEHGERLPHDHNYPEYFPQAGSNPQRMWVYPVSALGAFRIWLQSIYVPEKLPEYLSRKVSQGELPPTTRDLILGAVERMKLPGKP